MIILTSPIIVVIWELSFLLFRYFMRLIETHLRLQLQHDYTTFNRPVVISVQSALVFRFCINMLYILSGILIYLSRFLGRLRGWCFFVLWGWIGSLWVVFSRGGGSGGDGGCGFWLSFTWEDGYGSGCWFWSFSFCLLYIIVHRRY